jgi:hypothetical protein
MFKCLDCFNDFDITQGVVTNNGQHEEFICQTCASTQVCGACGFPYPLANADSNGYHAPQFCDAVEVGA